MILGAVVIYIWMIFSFVMFTDSLGPSGTSHSDKLTQPEIRERLALVLEENGSGPLSEVFDFDWDEAFWVGPYSYAIELEERTGYVFNIKPLNQSERSRIIFFQDGVKVYDFEYNRYETPLAFTDRDLDETASFSVDDSGWIVIGNEDSDGRFVPPY